MTELVRGVGAAINIPFTVGGGISDVDDIRPLLESGADKISINTAAVRDPQLLARAADEFGSQCVVLAIDASGHVMATYMTQTGYLNGSTPVYTARPTAMRYLLGLGGWASPDFLDELETYNNTSPSTDSRLQSVVEASGSVLVMWTNETRNMKSKRFE